MMNLNSKNKTLISDSLVHQTVQSTDIPNLHQVENETTAYALDKAKNGKEKMYHRPSKRRSINEIAIKVNVYNGENICFMRFTCFFDIRSFKRFISYINACCCGFQFHLWHTCKTCI